MSFDVTMPNGLTARALGPFLCATVVGPDVRRLERAYTEALGYRLEHFGKVSAELAAHWGAPAQAGRDQVVLAPESAGPGPRTWIRLVEGNAGETPPPLRTFGWAAIEILVQDPDALAERLRGPESSFEIIGGPADLDVSDDIRALQVVGPAGEVLYLTLVRKAVPPFELPCDDLAAAFVDRPFIAVLGCPDRDAAAGTYGAFGGVELLCFDSRVRVLQKAFGLPPEATFPMATAQLAGQSLVEIDELPAGTSPGAVPRVVPAGALPPAFAVASFAVDSLDADVLRGRLLSEPWVFPEPPYRGRRAAVLRGAAGELVELVERSREALLDNC